MTRDELIAAMAEEFGVTPEFIAARMTMTEDYERGLVKDVASKIGYGRLMQLAEQLWSQSLKPVARGGELSVGPAAGMLRTCRCVERGDQRCMWCCGTRRVTHRVYAAMLIEGY